MNGLDGECLGKAACVRPGLEPGAHGWGREQGAGPGPARLVQVQVSGWALNLKVPDSLDAPVQGQPAGLGGLGVARVAWPGLGSSSSLYTLSTLYAYSLNGATVGRCGVDHIVQNVAAFWSSGVFPSLFRRVSAFRGGVGGTLSAGPSGEPAARLGAPRALSQAIRPAGGGAGVLRFASVPAYMPASRQV